MNEISNQTQLYHLLFALDEDGIISITHVVYDQNNDVEFFNFNRGGVDYSIELGIGDRYWINTYNCGVTTPGIKSMSYDELCRVIESWL